MSSLKVGPVTIAWHSDLPVYAGEAFLQSEGGQFGWIGGTDESGELRCILPFSIIDKLGFRMVRFRTATLPMANELTLDEEREFLGGVVEYLRSSSADVIIPSGNAAIFRTYPQGAIAAPYGTFVNDLRKSETVLMGGIRKTYRQNIRKATAAGVEIKCGPAYLDASYELVSSTLERSGSKFTNYREFKRRVLALGECVKIFVAEHQGTIQGCMVAPFSRQVAYNCYAGSRPEPVLGAMHLLHWEAIRHFRNEGVKEFDFQGVRIIPEKGSKQEGIFHYKQGFGGELVQGYLWKYPLRPLRSMAYSVAVRMLMGGDVVDQEQRRCAVAEAS